MQAPPRLVCRQTYYHQRPGEEPTSAEPRFMRWLASDEQRYSRQLRLTGEPQTLDTGWVKTPGLVLIANDEPPPKSPATDEEKRRVQSVTVLIAHAGEVILLVPPGEAQPLSLVDPSHFSVCTRGGTARVTVTAFPS